MIDEIKSRYPSVSAFDFREKVKYNLLNTFWKARNFPKGMHKKVGRLYFTSSLNKMGR
jgi:hypothetical protein